VRAGMTVVPLHLVTSVAPIEAGFWNTFQNPAFFVSVFAAIARCMRIINCIFADFDT
jgi:hypothetical protein